MLRLNLSALSLVVAARLVLPQCSIMPNASLICLLAFGTNQDPILIIDFPIAAALLDSPYPPL